MPEKRIIRPLITPAWEVRTASGKDGFSRPKGDAAIIVAALDSLAARLVEASQDSGTDVNPEGVELGVFDDRARSIHARRLMMYRGDVLAARKRFIAKLKEETK